MSAVKKQKTNVVFSGIGGPHMQKQGLKSIGNLSGVMGFLEIILKFFHFFSLIRLLVKRAIEFQPDLVITIDSWDFCKMVVKRLRKGLQKAKFVHYVSPSVWLYRQGRIKEMKELYDLLLVIFPFETKLYEKVGMPCKYVGHPVIEDFNSSASTTFRHKYKIPKNTKILCIMVGSRSAEIKRMLPIFITAAEKFLSKQQDQFLVIFPAINATAVSLIQATPMTFDKLVIDTSKLDDTMRTSMFKSFHLALAKSGTTTLEMTLASVPMVVAYKTDRFSMFIAKYVFKLHKKTKYICMTNILLDELAVPEFIQEHCNPDKIVDGLQFIMNPEVRKNMLLKYKKVGKMLSHGRGSAPGIFAAKCVLSCLSNDFK